jgi:Ca2+-binding EF-hand superfamily protein
MAPEIELVTKVRNLLVQKHGNDSVASLQKSFYAYDRNNSGRLEADELAQVLTDAGIGNKFTRGMWVKGILAKLDQDRDDAITWDDFSGLLDKAA